MSPEQTRGWVSSESRPGAPAAQRATGKPLRERGAHAYLVGQGDLVSRLGFRV